MDTRERPPDVRATRPTGTPPEAGADLDATRVDADRLLAAADDAIERALSADSRAFLAANRQHGGQ